MKLLSKGEKIGIIGGTFNPIHIGHLRSAEEVREAFGLERVIFIPSASPPHKDKGNIIDARHRYKMVRLAVAKNPYFFASDIEIKRRGTSYTVDTLRYIREKGVDGINIYFILGIDAFLEIETWKEARELFGLADFIVTNRPNPESPNQKLIIPKKIEGAFRKTDKNIFTHKSGHRIYYQEISALDISSSNIRERIKSRKSIRYLVTDNVKKYIEKRGLYR
jgi:nicotinate-nucleotide adenylyltransferase